MAQNAEVELVVVVVVWETKDWEKEVDKVQDVMEEMPQAC